MARKQYNDNTWVTEKEIKEAWGKLKPNQTPVAALVAESVKVPDADQPSGYVEQRQFMLKNLYNVEQLETRGSFKPDRVMPFKSDPESIEETRQKLQVASYELMGKREAHDYRNPNEAIMRLVIAEQERENLRHSPLRTHIAATHVASSLNLPNTPLNNDNDYSRRAFENPHQVIREATEAEHIARGIQMNLASLYQRDIQWGLNAPERLKQYKSLSKEEQKAFVAELEDRIQNAAVIENKRLSQSITPTSKNFPASNDPFLEDDDFDVFKEDWRDKATANDFERYETSPNNSLVPTKNGSLAAQEASQEIMNIRHRIQNQADGQRAVRELIASMGDDKKYDEIDTQYSKDLEKQNADLKRFDNELLVANNVEAYKDILRYEYRPQNLEIKSAELIEQEDYQKPNRGVYGASFEDGSEDDRRETYKINAEFKLNDDKVELRNAVVDVVYKTEQNQPTLHFVSTKSLYQGKDDIESDIYVNGRPLQNGSRTEENIYVGLDTRFTKNKLVSELNSADLDAKHIVKKQSL